MIIAQERTERRNNQITAQELRVIGADGQQIGVLRRGEALRRAEEAGLDLVEISPNATPPVCKIIDYGKYQYEKQKAAHAAKVKQKVTELKEIKFRPGTEDGDYQTKLRHIKSFLDDGDKVKISLRFRGREMSHQNIGLELMNKLKADLDGLIVIEQHPRLDGRQMVMMMSPKKAAA